MSWQPAVAAAEVGFALRRDAWNRGYMSKALAEIIRFGFERLSLERIETRYAPDNLASWRLLEKCGLLCERTVQDPKSVEEYLTDFRLYAMSSKEHRARRESVGHPSP